MTQKLNAAAELKRFAQMFKGLVAAADELEKVGTLEQAANEAKSRLEQYKGQENAAKKKVEAAEKRAAEREEQAKVEATAAKQEIDKHRKDGEARARKMVSDAEVKANAAILEANERIRKLQRVITEKEGELERLKAEISEREQVLKKVRAELEALRGRL